MTDSRMIVSAMLLGGTFVPDSLKRTNQILIKPDHVRHVV
jgi:hypothetical protein